MIKVEGGTFKMLEILDINEVINSNITLSTFYMARYVVTQEEFESVMGFNPSKFIGKNNPVEQITWFDALMYCNKLSEKEELSPYYSISDIEYVSYTICNVIYDDYIHVANLGETKNIFTATVRVLGGNGYRLPTEAEWEYAARGGNPSKGYIYAGSNNIDEVAWHDKNSGDKTHPVGTKKPNELGLYDMSGNVWEWCWDMWADYTKEDKINPTGPINGEYYIIRGGSWIENIITSRVDFRSDSRPDFRYCNKGFRIVKSLEGN